MFSFGKFGNKRGEFICAGASGMAAHHICMRISERDLTSNINIPLPKQSLYSLPLLHDKPLLFKVQNRTLRREHLIADHALNRHSFLNRGNV